MEHISKFEILELVAGRLSPQRQRLLEEHLSHCSDCALEFEQAARTWDILSRWQPDSPGIDLSANLAYGTSVVNFSNSNPFTALGRNLKKVRIDRIYRMKKDKQDNKLKK